MNVPVQRLGDWADLRVSLVQCYEGRVPWFGRGVLETDYQTAWLVLRGWGRVTDEGRPPITATAGWWMFPKPGRRLQEFSPRAQLLSVGVVARYLTNQPLFNLDRTIRVAAEAFPEIQTSSCSIIEATTTTSGNIRHEAAAVDIFWYFRVQPLVLRWADTWCRVLTTLGYDLASPHTADPRVQRAMQYLHIHVGDNRLTGEQVADHGGVSLRQLDRLFMQETGLTLNEYRTKQRLERAMRLLIHSELSIKEIAFDLGFRRQGHFTAWFHKHRHQSPSSFRKQIKFG